MLRGDVVIPDIPIVGPRLALSLGRSWNRSRSFARPVHPAVGFHVDDLGSDGGHGRVDGNVGPECMHLNILKSTTLTKYKDNTKIPFSFIASPPCAPFESRSAAYSSPAWIFSPRLGLPYPRRRSSSYSREPSTECRSRPCPGSAPRRRRRRTPTTRSQRTRSTGRQRNSLWRCSSAGSREPSCDVREGGVVLVSCGEKGESCRPCSCSGT